MTKPNTKISDVMLSVRSMEMLEQMEITTVVELAKLSAEEILAHPNGNKLVVKELTMVVEEAGLALRE